MATRKTTFTLRLVVEETFSDEEPPSLSGIPTYDTTLAEEPTQTRAIVKCRTDERKRRTA
jgi:hypothetical protein